MSRVGVVGIWVTLARMGQAEGGSMRDFWDQRAAEDAFYFVDNRLDYGHPDMEAFWEGGRSDLDTILGELGVELRASDDVVEIGCGVGRITRVLAARAESVRALDVSGRMIELARQHNGELVNVEWIHGDGASLTGVETESADVCFSHVVFQHIPDPAITLAYVREIGRVLRPGGWAAFQVSDLPVLHERRPAAERVRALARSAFRRGPRGQGHAAWLGSAVDLDALRNTAAASGAPVERVSGAGTQFCLVLMRKPAAT
jgi:SAM-dependent methyltransferase